MNSPSPAQKPARTSRELLPWESTEDCCRSSSKSSKSSKASKASSPDCVAAKARYIDLRDLPSPGSKNSLLIVSQVFVDIFSFLEPFYRHYLLTLPLCRAFRSETSLQLRTWKAFLVAEPLCVKPGLLAHQDRQASQALHLRLSQDMFRLRSAEVDGVAEVMRRTRCCPSVQMQAMDRLNTLLEDESRRTAAQRGCVPAVIFETMRECAQDEALLARALYTTMLVLRPKGGSEGCLFKGDEMSSLHVPAVTEQGVETVLRCMRQYVGSRRLQYMGCWAMVNMALEPSHKSKLLEAGAIKTVCAAMDAHAGDAKVQFRALFALINLVTVGGVSQTDSARSTEQLIARVVAVTRKFLSNLDVAGRGCMVLYNLSLDSANHDFLLQHNATGLLRDAARLHPVDHMLTFVFSSTVSRIGRGSGADGHSDAAHLEPPPANEPTAATTTTIAAANPSHAAVGRGSRHSIGAA